MESARIMGYVGQPHAGAYRRHRRAASGGARYDGEDTIGTHGGALPAQAECACALSRSPDETRLRAFACDRVKSGLRRRGLDRLVSATERLIIYAISTGFFG